MAEEEVQHKEEAQKKLRFAAILLITINSIMGTSIFFFPAVGAREAGLFSLISRLKLNELTA